jgi:hypothetical protein
MHILDAEPPDFDAALTRRTKAVKTPHTGVKKPLKASSPRSKQEYVDFRIRPYPRVCQRTQEC